MSYIAPETNVREAITRINTTGQTPVVLINGKSYVLNTSAISRGLIIYTEFESGQPIRSIEARYAAYHSVSDIILNPVPKRELDTIVDSSIPIEAEILPINKILAGYL